MKKQWKEAELETVDFSGRAIVTVSGKSNDDEQNWSPWV